VPVIGEVDGTDLQSPGKQQLKKENEKTLNFRTVNFMLHTEEFKPCYTDINSAKLFFRSS
jgi:hypothetical protein